MQEAGHSLGAGGPLTKFKRQMSLTTQGCITPSGMEEQLRSLLLMLPLQPGRIVRSYRDAQDRLLWRDKTCPAHT